MSCIIAVAGKGGTGKTTIAALLVRVLKEKKGKSILAIDADPNNNLAENLGVKSNKTIADVLDNIASNPDVVPIGMTKDRYIEYQVQSVIQEAGGFDIISMGKPEGAGCYCYINNVLRNIMAKLIPDYDYIVIDNEAGFEHLSRRTTRRADVLLVVSDSTAAGLTAAERISRMTDQLNIEAKRKLLVVNRADNQIDDNKIKNLRLDYIGSIPLDRQIEKISVNGDSLMDLTEDAISLRALSDIGEKIWQGN